MTETLDVLFFFTRVQNKMCQRSKNAGLQSNIGQTPQLHYFANKFIEVCSHHAQDPKYKIIFVRRPAVDVFSIFRLDSVDCLPKVMWRGSIDAIASNLGQVLVADRSIYYNWTADATRGRAVVFHDDYHSASAHHLGTCFTDLDFSSKIFKLEKIQTFMGNTIHNSLNLKNNL
jgi:hypothetical protein